MNRKLCAAEALELLKHNSVFWSKLGWAYDPPRMDENGTTVMFFKDSSKLQRFHRDFYNAGIKIHSTILFSGWLDTHRYDYTETDRTLDEIFACGDDLYYLPRVKLNVPLNWGKENPEEMCVYYPGNLSAEEIAGLVNTPKHDVIGWDAECGYGAWHDAWKDNRPNLGGLIGNQSFTSKKWLGDAGDALRRFIRHLENSKYANRIIGYHFAYGMCGETSLWHSWMKTKDLRFADYGIGCRRMFFDWGIKRYGSPATLRRAWMQPELTRDNLKLPSPEEREFSQKNAEEFFRAHPENTICIDYEHFMTDSNADALEHFGRIIKEESGKIAGAFYGYYLNVPRAAYTGHLAFERILNSPHIDFLASPKAYRRVAPGEPGGEQVPAMSVNRKKLFIDELDNRTHLSGMESENMFQTRGILWREFAKNMMYHSSFWWMDLGGGWFDSPEIRNEISRIEKTAAEIRTQKAQSVSEVLAVTDENSFFAMKANSELHTDLLVESIAELHLCGTPVDHYRWDDLKTLDLSGYKCVFFMNCIEIPPQEWNAIRKRFHPGTVFCWHYAPGIRNPSYGPEHAEELCGLRLVLRPGMPESAETIAVRFKDLPQAEKQFRESVYPLFQIEPDGKAELTGLYSDGSGAVARTYKDGHPSYCVCSPFLRYIHYRKIMQRANVHFYAPPDSTVYADSRFTAVFSRSAMEFELPCKEDAEFREMILGETFRGNRIPVKLEEKDARFYLHSISPR